ncbi:TPA: helix-turn-helix transcriptional regulator [Clostridioides difficile]|uniref:helix-turn-helix domain-containing protein n=1 Tax=Clostridioides difficile TaxID=1496 RepID=UPI00097FF7C4|nr:helix-turn-helix transcriptional regulator [Clostridioides difficile]SJT09371.1 transcriptional repressor DicA [Clostridioides difficile]HBF4605154.1 helix-turn-helix transcriptional regulator [Clostridioides difficile]HBF4792692.1 helix-turn-helix transcriptional regulator [Clostridioides difficile]HBF5021916.1 helix-turn-helix transcriptional regulator [Clostridioides difficile]HBF5056468.1 helix-turn-helix transcriptional regulator [Clostridioides difficile]
MNTISERIMKIRAEQKLSQKDFGKVIGLSRSMISCYEKGLREITERSLNDICREFNINKEWLLTGKNEMYISREEDIPSILGEVFYKIASSKDENLKELVINISKLDAKYINNLNEIVKGLI